MIVIVSSRYDATARELLRQWAHDGAALLSAEDLIRPGWIIRPGDASDGFAVVAGRRVPVRDLHAVLTLRPAVLAEELQDIHVEDRDYVAAEINAMLMAWLKSLPCRVLNRPTATSLCGPGWTTLHWQAAAARCGIPRAGVDDSPTQTIVACNGQVRGTRSAALRTKALALARLAGVELMDLHLHKGRFVHAGTHPDFSSPSVRAMVRRALLARETA